MQHFEMKPAPLHSTVEFTRFPPPQLNMFQGNPKIPIFAANQERILYALKAGQVVNGHNQWNHMHKALSELFQCDVSTIVVSGFGCLSPHHVQEDLTQTLGVVCITPK